MDDFDRMEIAMGAVSPDRFANSDAMTTKINTDYEELYHSGRGVDAEVRKDYLHRISLLIIQYKPDVVKAMNNAGIQITLNSPDADFSKLIINGYADKNMSLVHNIAALMRAYEKRIPVKKLQ